MVKHAEVSGEGLFDEAGEPRDEVLDALLLALDIEPRSAEEE
jgi:hypothetical protein